MDERYLTLGDLVVDRQLRLLSSQFGNVKTTQRRIQLLEILAGQTAPIHPNKIIEIMWPDPDYEPEQAFNNITTHICNLRKDMNRIRCETYIDNVRGSGYVLRASKNQMVVKVLTPDLAEKFDRWVEWQQTLTA